MQSNHGFEGQLNACWTHKMTPTEIEMIRSAGFLVSVIHGRCAHISFLPLSSVFNLRSVEYLRCHFFPFALSRAEFVALPNCSCIYKPNGKSSLCLKFMFLLDLLCCFGVIFLLKTNLTCYQICRHDVIAQICYAKRLAQKLQPVARMVDLPGGHLVSHERTEEVYLHIYHTKYIYYS